MKQRNVIFLLSATFILQTGCAKKNNSAKTLESRRSQMQQQQQKAVENPVVAPAMADESKTPPAPSIEERKVEKPATAEVVPVVVTPPPAPSPAPVSAPAPVVAPSTPVAKVAEKPAVEKPALVVANPAADSADIQKEETVKISFVDLDGFQKLANDQNRVLHQGQQISRDKPEKIIGLEVEGHFCEVRVNGSLHPKDFLKVEGMEPKVLDADKDFYNMVLKFKNANATVEFDCSYATSNFYIQEFQINFAKFLVIYDPMGKPYDTSKFVNLRTQERLLHSFQVAKLEEVKKVIFSESAAQGYAVAAGKVDKSQDQAKKLSDNQVEAACMVDEKSTEIKTGETYILVGQGFNDAPPGESQIVSKYYMYLSKEGSQLKFRCRMHKKSTVYTLMTAFGDHLKFGTLGRVALKEELVKMQAAYEKLKSEKK